MECVSIPPAELPRTTPLYTTFLNDFPRLAEFYGHPPTLEGALNAAAEVHLEDSVRRAVAEALSKQNQTRGGDGATDKNLKRLASGAVAVVTGQQVGILGGPALSVYKALTAIRVAAELTARGADAVPVFWMATEDHDFAEVNHCFFGTRGGFERFELDAQGLEGRRVGEIRLGKTIEELSARAAGILEGPSAKEVGRWITESYRPGETLGSAFAKLTARMLAGRGVIFLDPVDPELHRLAAPTIVRAIRESEILSRELLSRSGALERAGYHAQVKVAEGSTLVFRMVEGQRLALRAQDGDFAAGNKRESVEETLKAVERHPEEFSASALLRPVIQDALLPTAAYIGGAAEVAYYAQSSVILQRLLGRVPAVVPRAGFSLVNAHVRNLLKKYKLDVRDVFAGRQALRARLEAEVLPESLSQRFVEGEGTLSRLFEGLREPLGALDKTLLGALDTAREKILFQFNGLRGKAGRAEGLRMGVLDAHEKEIMSFLFPNNSLQERSLSLLPMLAREGAQLISRLEQHIKLGSGDHCVLFL